MSLMTWQAGPIVTVMQDHCTIWEAITKTLFSSFSDVFPKFTDGEAGPSGPVSSMSVKRPLAWHENSLGSCVDCGPPQGDQKDLFLKPFKLSFGIFVTCFPNIIAYPSPEPAPGRSWFGCGWSQC